MPEVRANGVSLYYEEYGTGPAILGIHGTGSSVALWAGAASELGKRGPAIVYGVVLSVHDTKGFDLTRFVGIDHYVRAILGDAVFQRSLLNPVLFTGVAVLLQTGPGLLLAVPLVGGRRGLAFVLFAFFAPFLLAPVPVGGVAPARNRLGGLRGQGGPGPGHPGGRPG